MTHDDTDNTFPILAWRSLAISLAIGVVTSVLYEVAQTQVMMASVGIEMPLWRHYLTDFFVRYGIGFSICIGALYLALRVQRRWLLNAIVYLLVYIALVLIRYSIAGFSIGIVLQFCYPIFLSCPVVFLVSSLARWYFGRSRFSASNERIRFGISTVFWGSSIVGLSLFLAIWNMKAFQEFSSNLSLEDLQNNGAVFDATNNRLSIDSRYLGKPIRLRDAVTISTLEKKITVDFLDCDITDEVIALFKTDRPVTIRFENCEVVREMSPSGIVNIGNEANEPLPSELPR